EGWSNNLVLHTGAKSRGSVDKAHEVANWLLSGYYGAKLAQLRGYAVPNEKAIAYAKANAGFDPKKKEEISTHVREKFLKQPGKVYWQNVRPRNHKQYESWWAKLRTA
ncbi:MAG: spermidine/putrescine ABC transporter, partial [Bacteroidota bacterium]